MRVYIFSHIRLFSETLAAYLKSCKEVSEVIACHQADHFVEEVLNFSPDIVLIDASIECALVEARAVNYALPEIPILAIALSEKAEKVIACADAGLVGYFSPQGSVKELSLAICSERSGVSAFVRHQSPVAFFVRSNNDKSLFMSKNNSRNVNLSFSVCLVKGSPTSRLHINWC